MKIMAKSKYEYVKEFESQEKCLPNCWLVVRVDGRGFSKFADKHRFKKPNDSRSLNLMNMAAKELMKEIPDIVLAYGQSDEYSFVLRKESTLYNRRPQKLVSVICSMFTAYYIVNWGKFFNSEVLTTPPAFDGRIIQYPSDSNLRDYLAWRQADVHINNLYNTCFWNLVQKKKLSHQEAEEQLKGTVSSEKNELLFSEFGINYNNEPEEFRKGTVIIKSGKKKFEQFNTDIIGDAFWDEHKEILDTSSDLPVMLSAQLKTSSVQWSRIPFPVIRHIVKKFCLRQTRFKDEKAQVCPTHIDHYLKIITEADLKTSQKF